MITVLLVDDQAVVREGLRVILEAAGDISVVGEAADGAAAVELVARTPADIVLMDVRMPRMDGIEATRRIVGCSSERSLHELPRVVMLSTFGEDDYVFGAFRAGASGFLLKDADRSQLVNGVRATAAGDRLLAPELTRRLIERFVSRPPPTGRLVRALADLTDREREVAGLVARGLSNAEIAERLVVSHGTVRTHVGHILQKTGLRDRVQLVVLAYEAGLVEPGAQEHREAGPGPRLLPSAARTIRLPSN